MSRILCAAECGCYIDSSLRESFCVGVLTVHVNWRKRPRPISPCFEVCVKLASPFWLAINQGSATKPRLHPARTQTLRFAFVAVAFVAVARLNLQATTRLRDFIMQKIYAVRRPMSNLQMQQNTLVNFREAFRFLTAHSPKVATTIKQEYTETFGKVHWSYFSEYVTRLMRLQVRSGHDHATCVLVACVSRE